MRGKAILRRRPKEIFLSHSSLDRAFVANLAKVFRHLGIRYWYSASHIAGAKQWHDEIGRALERCDWFLVVLSPGSVKSKWVKRELLFALNKDSYNERIIPALRKPCKYSRLSWMLSEYQFVDFTAGFDADCRQLLRIWGLSPKAPSGSLGYKKKR